MLSPIVRLYAEEAPAVLNERFTATRCLNATFITCEVLGRFGMRTEPASVITIACNHAFYDQSRRLGRLPRVAELQDGAWALGVDERAEDDDRDWNGHLVTLVKGSLVDASACGMRREARGIFAPDLAVFDTTPAFLRGRESLTFLLAEGGRIVYRIRRGDRSWVDFPGMQPSVHNLEAAGEIADRMRARQRRSSGARA